MVLHLPVKKHPTKHKQVIFSLPDLQTGQGTRTKSIHGPSKHLSAPCNKAQCCRFSFLGEVNCIFSQHSTQRHTDTQAETSSDSPAKQKNLWDCTPLLSKAEVAISNLLKSRRIQDKSNTWYEKQMKQITCKIAELFFSWGYYPVSLFSIFYSEVCQCKCKSIAERNKKVYGILIT